jgi:hypothetical protein
MQHHRRPNTSKLRNVLRARISTILSGRRSVPLLVTFVF